MAKSSPGFRWRFSLTHLLIALCLCGVVASWWQDHLMMQRMRDHEDVLIEQVRDLQQVNRQLTLQLNERSTKESDSSAESRPLAATLLDRLLEKE